MTSSDLWDEDDGTALRRPRRRCSRPTCSDPAVDVLAGLAGAGRRSSRDRHRAGGRPARRARGVPVGGIELSQPMVEQLRRKATRTTIPVVVGDMATATVPGEFARVPGVEHHRATCAPRTSRSRASATPPGTSRPAAGSSSSVGARPAAAPARPSGRPFGVDERLPRRRHLRRRQPAGDVAPCPDRRGRGSSSARHATSGTSGRPSSTSWPARRLELEQPRRRLERNRVHRRERRRTCRSGDGRRAAFLVPLPTRLVVVLVEGRSDRAALAVPVGRRGLDRAVDVREMGGATNVRRHLHDAVTDAGTRRVLGLCDEAEADFVRRALTAEGARAGTAQQMEASASTLCARPRGRAPPRPRR